jgi:hypothetical protein
MLNMTLNAKYAQYARYDDLTPSLEHSLWTILGPLGNRLSISRTARNKDDVLPSNSKSQIGAQLEPGVEHRSIMR